MVDAVNGAGRRKTHEVEHYGFQAEPPATGKKPPAVGWHREPPPVIPDVTPVSKLTTSGMDTTALAAEIMRLKKAHAPPEKIIALQSEWVTRAKAEGRPEPKGPLDPFRATPNEIENAFLWAAAGGVIPRDELARDGGKTYLASIRDAAVLRTRGFDAMLALHEGNPDEQRALLAQELPRRGVKVPEGASLDQLRALHAQSKRDEESRRKTIGLDGRTGTAESIDAYERQEAIDAMNPGTTIGSLMATFSTITGDVDVERMRTLGQAGNTAEAMLDKDPSTDPKKRW